VNVVNKDLKLWPERTLYFQTLWRGVPWHQKKGLIQASSARILIETPNDCCKYLYLRSISLDQFRYWFKKTKK